MDSGIAESYEIQHEGTMNNEIHFLLYMASPMDAS